MTIDEVIAHCEDVVNTNKELCERDNDYYKNQVQIQCSYEHQQLATWLKEYKKLLGAIEDIKAEITEPNEMDSLENSNLWQGWFLKLIDKHTGGKEDA